jgi:hypothetical protein
MTGFTGVLNSQIVTILHESLLHRHYCSSSWFSLRRLFDSYGLVFVGRPLWREDGSVFCTCCWPLSAQSFSGPSPLALATVFYCLRFESSLFVAAYDSQSKSTHSQPIIEFLSSLGRDRVENISSNISSSVTTRSYRTDHVENTASKLPNCCLWRICCLATSVFAEPFPSNCCLCSLHSFCLERICRNIQILALGTLPL